MVLACQRRLNTSMSTQSVRYLIDRPPREEWRYFIGMNAPTSVQQQAWMAQWRSAAVELARVGQAELSNVDLSRVAADLEEACVASARADQLAPATSGLIDQQRWMHRRIRA